MYCVSRILILAILLCWDDRVARALFRIFWR